MLKPHAIILGIRGLPAQHGGFETFAEYLSTYLLDRGWSVSVYCQNSTIQKTIESEWNGIQLIQIPVKQCGPLGTIIFDFKSIVHSLKFSGVFLTLGYNTAVFNILHRIFGKTNLINMDGIEWKREKWGKTAKLWFWINEYLGCRFGNHLISDHPSIEDHLSRHVSRSKVTTIPYGAREVSSADECLLEGHFVKKDNYVILVARPEPENSILEIVSAFSSKPRGKKLLVVGEYSPDDVAYHQRVLDAANEDVIFTGAVYDKDQLDALRFHCRAYVHGHQVGGTNPSLVEALGAGSAVLAHDNKFNRWVTKNSALYFNDISSASLALDKIFSDDALVQTLREESYNNFNSNFRWETILRDYENLLRRWHP